MTTARDAPAVGDVVCAHLFTDVPVPVTCQLALLGAMSLLGLEATLAFAFTPTLLSDLTFVTNVS
jgi:hypothetical protein